MTNLGAIGRFSHTVLSAITPHHAGRRTARDALQDPIHIVCTTPLLVRQDITPQLLLPSLNEVYVCEHTVRLEPRRKLTRDGRS